MPHVDDYLRGTRCEAKIGVKILCIANYSSLAIYFPRVIIRRSLLGFGALMLALALDEDYVLGFASFGSKCAQFGRCLHFMGQISYLILAKREDRLSFFVGI